MAVLPHDRTDEVADMLEDMLLMKCVRLKNYMVATLLPGNPLLHTSGSVVYLDNYKKGQMFPEQIYYCQSWTDECSEFLCRFSDEMMEVCEKLPIDLTEVESIQKYYESPTPKDLTRKFHEIPSYNALLLPMKKVQKSVFFLGGGVCVALFLISLRVFIQRIFPMECVLSKHSHSLWG